MKMILFFKGGLPKSAKPSKPSLLAKAETSTAGRAAVSTAPRIVAAREKAAMRPEGAFDRLVRAIETGRLL